MRAPGSSVPVASASASASTSTPESASAPQWDAERGEWVGRRAMALDEEALEIPSPLYIFGYGSLMFKPEESFADCERIDGRVYGWKRLWAQRSCDHRGVPHQPGIVCTVLSDDELRELGLLEEQSGPSVTHGVAYKIPDDQVQKVLDELDFREKGGYTRAVVEFHHSGTGEVLKALLYTGNAQNPNFHALPHDVAAHVIAWAIGPSGRNIEYFLNVHEYLERAGAECAETFALVDLVREVRALGLDRRPVLDPRHQPKWRPVALQGWGSNERGQLGVADGGPSDAVEHASPVRTRVEVDLQRGWGGTVRQLAAGGAHSALLADDGHLFLWGGNEAGQLGTGGTPGRVLVDGPDQVHPFPRRVAMVALGHAHTLVLEQGTGQVFGVGANGVGEATGRRGAEGRGDCREDGGALVRVSSLEEGEGDGVRRDDDVRIRFVAAGVRHSAGITEGGALVTLGGRTHGEGLPPGVGPWRPADGAEVVSVACGWRHTVLLDARGRVYSLGAHKHGQRGLSDGNADAEATDPLPRCVPLEAEVEEVASGWSHVLARTRDGQVYGWGRNTFGQLGLGPDAPARVVAPVRLPLPECAVPVRHIAAGSEFSLVVGADGGVYMCGWNEHANLGQGHRDDSLVWVRVPMPESMEALARSGQLLVACGGAHVLTLAREPTEI